MLCPYCQEISRTWEVLAGDRYCGLCGRVLFDVEVSAGQEGGESRSSDNGRLIWMIVAGATHSRSVIFVRNAGCFSTEVSSVSVESRSASGQPVAGTVVQCGFSGPLPLANH